MHTQGTEEPSKILPRIVKAGGECGFGPFFFLLCFLFVLFLNNLALISVSVYII